MRAESNIQLANEVMFSEQPTGGPLTEPIFSSEATEIVGSDVLGTPSDRGLFEKVISSLPEGISQNIRKAGLAGAGAFMAIAAACGGGEGDGSQVTLSTVEPNPTGGQTVISVPTKEPTVTSTPKIETTPVVQGPTEAEKANTRDQADERLDLLSDEISALSAPLSPRVDASVLKAQQAEIDSIVDKINDSLEKGDLTSARASLSDLKRRIIQIGDVEKSDPIPEELKNKHDPQGRYIDKFDLVDPRTLPWFLATVDILVAFDGQPSSSTK